MTPAKRTKAENALHVLRSIQTEWWTAIHELREAVGYEVDAGTDFYETTIDELLRKGENHVD